MVVDHVEDLDIVRVGRADVGGVHLRTLVRVLGGGAEMGAPEAFVGLGFVKTRAQSTGRMVESDRAWRWGLATCPWLVR